MAVDTIAVHDSIDPSLSHMLQILGSRSLDEYLDSRGSRLTQTQAIGPTLRTATHSRLGAAFIKG